MHVREEVQGVRKVGARMAKANGAAEAPALLEWPPYHWLREHGYLIIWGNWGILARETDTWDHLS